MVTYFDLIKHSYQTLSINLANSHVTVSIVIKGTSNEQTEAADGHDMLYSDWLV